MVRCSIKRIIKTIIFFIILILIIKNFPLSSQQSDINKFKLKENSSEIIIILSNSHSKIIQRLILFLNELHLSYNQYKKIDQNLLNNIPSIIILDYIPNKDFYNFINQYQINLLIFLNNKCQNCITINFSQMLFENVTYPTIDFNQNELKPINHTIKSPFKIQQLNPLIKLLRFKDILPYFHSQHKQCIGIKINKNISANSIIYVQDKITFEKINLLIVISKKEIYLSECLYSHWFIWPLMMDILRYLTSDKYNSYGLNRYIQIDIDDIFLGRKTNDRFKSDDIYALIRSQLFIRNYIPNFRYRLGFSGFYYDEDNEGDRLLMSKFLLIEEKY